MNKFFKQFFGATIAANGCQLAMPSAAQQPILAPQPRKVALSFTTFISFRRDAAGIAPALHDPRQAGRDAAGRTTNAVLILHGTGGLGSSFSRRNFAGVLLVPGQLLDATRYFIILPDGIGHGKSSKPSDGMHARFPQYDYDDMVAADTGSSTKGSASIICGS